MKFNHSREIYLELEPKKDMIIRIARFASELVESASQRESDCVKITIKVRYENQDMEFLKVSDAEENMPPLKSAESFVVSSVYNAFGVVEHDGPEFHLYVEYTKKDNRAWINSDSTKDVVAQDLLLEMESCLAQYCIHEPSETHSTERQSDSCKKFYKMPIFWATAASAIVTAIFWAVDRFILGK